jgi:hypothetical protein
MFKPSSHWRACYHRRIRRFCCAKMVDRMQSRKYLLMKKQMKTSICVEMKIRHQDDLIDGMTSALGGVRRNNCE